MVWSTMAWLEHMEHNCHFGATHNGMGDALPKPCGAWSIPADVLEVACSGWLFNNGYIAASLDI